MVNGGFGFEVMNRAAMDAFAKQYSQSIGSKYSPWSTQYAGMGKKTVIKARRMNDTHLLSRRFTGKEWFALREWEEKEKRRGKPERPPALQPVLKYMDLAIGTSSVCVLSERGGRSPELLADESVDAIITDHPWEDTASNKGGNRSFADFECFRYTEEDFKEKARVLKQGCFLAEILPEENENNYEYLYRMKQMAGRAGLLYYCKVPWKKGGFVSNTGRKAKNIQDVMIFSKGKARSLRPDAKRIKQEGRTIYMSGAVGIAALETGRDSVLIENRETKERRRAEKQAADITKDIYGMPPENML